MYVAFEKLVRGAGRGRPRRANPVPYEAITRLCRDYGNAVLRRAYANWATPQFGRYQQDLAMNGVDLIQLARFGAAQKNAADIRITVDATETLIIHPEINVFVLVSGDGDYTPLVQRLREYGKHVVGVGTESNANPPGFSLFGVQVLECSRRPGRTRATCAPHRRFRHRHRREAACQGVGAGDSGHTDRQLSEEHDDPPRSGIRRTQLRLPQLPRLPGSPAATDLRRQHFRR